MERCILTGWYAGNENPDFLRISRFKEQVGGVIVKNYVTEYPLTLEGQLFFRVRR